MSEKRLITLVRNCPRVFICGNGGSAANAIHLANDWISVGIRAQALTADVATLTAIANDFDYAEIFSRQIEVLGELGDLLVTLSGSGNSTNILRAIYRARQRKMRTFAIVGGYHREPPASAKASDQYVAAGKDMQSAEEAQLRIGHMVMKALKRRSA